MQETALVSTVESRVSYVEKGKSGARQNKLNELSGKDWIKFTKSWFVHRPEPRGDQKIRHPASFPESLVREFILLDRKSTRLNSSHTVISYAVFCLKKKNNI